MEIVFVAAYGENGEMGKNNELLWYLPGDLPRFKQLTIGSPIIMGRKTFDSIGKPLPGRTNIVLSANKQWSQPGVTVASSIDESLELARAEQPEKVSIIGGGQIYKLFLPFATILEITYVYDAPVADTYFPNFSEDDFTEINRIEVRDSQPHFDYITYHRK
ncbi:MAG: dihydrofolate reductase [Arenicella sp.]|jgi:dihydrofolate reductase|nr:dihydrofolate reductase [Arenicella sp.]